MQSFRLWLRLAVRLRDALDAYSRRQWRLGVIALNPLQNLYRQIQLNRKLMDHALDRQWLLGVPVLELEYRKFVAQLLSTLTDLSASAAGTICSLPSLADIVAELKQLHDEMGEVSIDFEQRFFSVTIGPIRLADIDLGAFHIRLQWQQLPKKADVECFKIIALDPHSATLNADVTHPHVRDGSLCAGDAKVPINSALEQGRFADAFLLVRSVLCNYNPASAYAALENWEGCSCADCGQVVGNGDHACCHSCDQDYCDDCIAHCHVCSAGRCRTCLEPCADCQQLCCPSCLKDSAWSDRECCRHCLTRCDDCGSRVARSELDENDRCRACAETDETVLEQESLNPMEISHETTTAATPN